MKGGGLKPVRVPIPSGEVHVGRVVEITFQEELDLLDCADEMRRAAHTCKAGWFERYLTAHRRAHGIIRTIFARSHEIRPS